jgi:hypothetical protein
MCQQCADMNVSRDVSRENAEMSVLFGRVVLWIADYPSFAKLCGKTPSLKVGCENFQLLSQGTEIITSYISR